MSVATAQSVHQPAVSKGSVSFSQQQDSCHLLCHPLHSHPSPLHLLGKEMCSQLGPWLTWGHSREDEGRTALPARSPDPAEAMPLLSPALQQRCPKQSHCLGSDLLRPLTDLPTKQLPRRVWPRISVTPGDLHTTSAGSSKPSTNSASNKYRAEQGPEKDFCPIERNMAVDSFSSRWWPVILSLKFREKSGFFQWKFIEGKDLKWVTNVIKVCHHCWVRHKCQEHLCYHPVRGTGNLCISRNLIQKANRSSAQHWNILWNTKVNVPYSFITAFGTSFVLLCDSFVIFSTPLH